MMRCGPAIAALMAHHPQSPMRQTGVQAQTTLMSSSTIGGSAKGKTARVQCIDTAFERSRLEAPQLEVGTRHVPAGKGNHERTMLRVARSGFACSSVEEGTEDKMAM